MYSESPNNKKTWASAHVLQLSSELFKHKNDYCGAQLVLPLYGPVYST